jgi:hypothetical protein
VPQVYHCIHFTCKATQSEEGACDQKSSFCQHGYDNQSGQLPRYDLRQKDATLGLFHLPRGVDFRTLRVGSISLKADTCSIKESTLTLVSEAEMENR